MPLFSRPERSGLGQTVGLGIRAVRLLFRGSVGSSRWVTRRVGQARARGAGGETGMVRLFDLHALSCAGDTLIAIGLAGTIFFSAPLGEARGKVALYLLVTMVPFAMLAPVVGPLLDHFRHGRRYALATTMLGRAFLTWLISDYIHGFGLYPAAFGVLALSRAYGVARSAAVPRLLPAGLGLSQVGARASVYGTVAGAVVAPLGLAAFWFGPQWPLRVASAIFLVGMVIALRLPPGADSEPPERMPRPVRVMLGLHRDGTDRPLGRGRPAGRLVIATLFGAAILRGLYGFLLLFLAFAIKAGDLERVILGRELSPEAALGLVGGGLAVGTFLATALGTRLHIRHPTAVQSSGMIIVAGVGILATLRFSLPMVALFCLVTALASGVAKLTVDASIQERIPERLRASSFAHSETALMLAFVLGGALGLVPVAGWIGIAVAAGVGTLAVVRSVLVAHRLRNEKLLGRPLGDDELDDVRPGGTDPDDHPGADDPTPTSPAPAPAPAPAAATAGNPAGPVDDSGLAPPGYHIYRPSSAVAGSGGSDDDSRHGAQGPLP